MFAVTFRSRLIRILVIINLSVMALGLCAYYSLGKTKKRLEYLTSGVYSRLMIVDHLRNSAQQRAIAVRNIALLKQESARLAQVKVYEKSQEETHQAIEKLKLAVADDEATLEIRPLVEAIAMVEAKYAPVAKRIVYQLLSGESEAAITQIDTVCTPTLTELINAIDAYSNVTEHRTKDFVDSTELDTARLQTILLSVTLLMVAMTLCLGFLLFRSIRKTLGDEPEKLNIALNLLAEGNLLAPVYVDPDCNDSIAMSVANVQRQFGEVVRSVRTSSQNIEFSAAQIAASDDNLNERARDQANSLQETSQAMTTLSSIVQSNSSRAIDADKLARDASDAATNGGRVVQQVVETMGNINNSGRKIEDIVGMIDSIAFQTNLLALNAAVEAARAGEQGKGFAVVATEVRALAQRSANSAKEIKTLLHLNVEQLDQGTELVARAGESMQAILGSIKQLHEIVSCIARSATEQDNGIHQVVTYIGKMTEIINQNTALVEESADAANDLKSQAEYLVKSVSIFAV